MCGPNCSGDSGKKSKASGKKKPLDVLKSKYQARKGKVDRNEAGFASGTNTGMPSFGGGVKSRVGTPSLPIKGSGEDEKV